MIFRRTVLSESLNGETLKILEGGGGGGVGRRPFKSGSVAAAQKSCRDWIKQTIVFIVDSFYCFVSIVSRSVVLIQLD